MQKVYNERSFDDEAITCPRCGWEGSGYDTHIIDFYGLTKVKEVHCPNCDTYLGGVQNTDYRRSSRNSDDDYRGFGGDPLSNQFG